MKHFSFFSVLACSVLLLAGCSASRKAAVSSRTSFPSLGQGGRIAIVAHRGFWKCEEGGYSENSIASLRAAQNSGVWGSECDVHITADDVVIVNHDESIGGMQIATHKFAELSACRLPNGERRPSFDEYLDQAMKCRTTKLIVELKPQSAEAREDLLVEKTVAAIKAHGLYDPERVLFISFSRHICDKIAAEHPAFVNQFLSANFIRDESPEIYAGRGINGIDYHFKLFNLRPAYVERAHALGMSVNAWTVDEPKDIRSMIEAGVDAITTNKPLQVRELLGDREFRIK